MTHPEPQKSPMHDLHLKLGGRMMDFHGWFLPTQYTGIIEEHKRCRSSVGVFDVSHMGEARIMGPNSAEFCDYLLTNEPSKLEIGSGQYSLLCHPSGGIVDDLILYRMAKDEFLLVLNSSNTQKDLNHIQNILKNWDSSEKPKIIDESLEWGLIALQGPNAEKTLEKLTHESWNNLKRYSIRDFEFHSFQGYAARTGYTGEDGFEIFIPWNQTAFFFEKILESGSEFQILPCGLGARDTLRTEMKYPLYGQELTDETNPIEAGLRWAVKMKKPKPFIGSEKIAEFLASPPKRTLVGMTLEGRASARTGYLVFNQNHEKIGFVTSGTFSPTLEKPIAIAYLTGSFTAGDTVYIEIRSQKVLATLCKTPFIDPGAKKS